MKWLPSLALSAWIVFPAVASGSEHSPTNVPGLGFQQLARAVRVQRAVDQRILGQPGAIGTAITLSETEQPEASVMVLLEQDHPNFARLHRQIPLSLDGVLMRVEVSDPFYGSAKGNTGSKGRGKPGPSTGGTVDHTARQTLPIQLGTSGGWRYDTGNSGCCGGTLGGAVTFGGALYVLSAGHVLEGDVVAGVNRRLAGTGDYVVQPGLLDSSCGTSLLQNVGTLVRLGLWMDGRCDAGVAKALAGAVRSDGAILGVGTPSSATRAPEIGLLVKKSGRTTGVTRSSITGINASITVNYPAECGGSVAFSKTFAGLMIVRNLDSSFLAPGDSGALLLEDVATSPRACGLLFASSGAAAVAAPIEQVLEQVGTALNGGVPARAVLVGK